MILTYLKDLYSFSRARISLNILLMVGVSFLNGISILTIIPLLIIAGVIPAQDLTSIGWLNHLLLATGVHLNLALVLLFYVMLLVAIAVINYQLAQLSTSLENEFGNSLSRRVFSAIVSANWQYLLTANKSILTNCLTHEIIRVNTCTIVILNFVSQVLIIGVQTIIALLINPGFSILVILCAIMFGSASHVFFRRAKKQGFDFTRQNEKIMFAVNENLNGLREIKTYALEQQQITLFAKLRDAISNNIIKHVQTHEIVTFIYSAASAILISIIVFFAVKVFKLNISELIILFLIFARLWPLFTRSVNLLNHIAYNIPAYKNITSLEHELLNNSCHSHIPCHSREETQVSGNPENLIECSKRFKSKMTEVCLSPVISFQNVGFSYKQAQQTATLVNITFEINPGETIACVGASGSGKSTLADLLIGLLTPASGQILINGTPQDSELLGMWRSQIGYVPQDPFLFNDSIRNNLLWSAADKNDDEIWHVLKLAAIDELVKKLPDKLNSIVGERGIMLSGGERQRLVLARALLRNPTLLVLDEATSALDTKNEEKIRQAIQQLHGKLAIFMIAHRISTVMNADRIIVVDKGQIVEIGNYQTLVANPHGYFSKLR
jgi:ATP-binding cassette, subfamily C, bacterial